MDDPENIVSRAPYVSVPDGQRTTFVTTRWSLVLGVKDPTSEADAQEALAKLCSTYWYPLYAFTRRSGYCVDDAKDLIQGFFVYLLEKGIVARADRELGRFRTFLLACLRNHLKKQVERASAQKRGGGMREISWDEIGAEEKYLYEPLHEQTPERIFEQRWATTLLENTLDLLRADLVRRGKGDLFDHLKGHIWGLKEERSCAEVADHFKLSEGVIKVTVHRMRQRYRDLLRAEVADTVADPSDVDDELRHLISVVSA